MDPVVTVTVCVWVCVCINLSDSVSVDKCMTTEGSILCTCSLSLHEINSLLKSYKSRTNTVGLNVSDVLRMCVAVCVS